MAGSTRRQFLRSTGTAGIGFAVAASGSMGRTFGEPSAPTVVSSPNEKPALLGGKPTVTGEWPHWPWVSSSDEEAVLEVVRAGRWYRSRSVEQFEEAYAALNSARYCIATASGTTALVTSLGALGVGPGDEVIVPPFTFLATVTSVLLHYAMPVFVDSDINTFLMDAEKL